MDLIQIQMRLSGAREAAAEAKGVSSAIASTGTATEAAAAKSALAEKRVNRLRSAWSGMAKVAKIGAFGLAGGLAVLAIQSKKAVEQMTELSMVTAGLHRNLGLSNQEGSRWAAVAKARGIDSKSLTMSFTTLSRQMVAGAEDNAAYEDTFKRLGIRQDEVKAGTKDFSGFVTRLADAFGDAEGGAERQALAQKLLGRGYQSVLPLFADGAKSLQEQLDWADKYHVTMGGQMVKDNMALVAAQRESKVAWLGIQQTLASRVIPILTDAQGEFQDIAKVLTDPKLTDAQKFQIIGKKLAHAADVGFDAFVTMLPEIANRAGEAAPKIAGALVHGFLGANVWGKLAIGTWIGAKLGGGVLLGKAAALGGGMGMKMGAALAERVGLWLIGTGVADSLLNTFGADGKIMTTLGPKVRAAGGALGRSFGLAFVTFGLAEITNTDWSDLAPGGESLGGNIQALKAIQIANNAQKSASEAAGNVPSGRGRTPANRPRIEPLPRGRTDGGGTSTMRRELHVHFSLDGREVGKRVLDLAETDLALA